MGSWVLDEEAHFFRAERLRVPQRTPRVWSSNSCPRGPASAVLDKGRQPGAPRLGLIGVTSLPWLMTESPRCVARCLAREGKTLSPKHPLLSFPSLRVRPNRDVFLGHTTRTPVALPDSADNKKRNSCA